MIKGKGTVGNRFVNAMKAVRKWNRSKHDLPLLIAAVIALWIVLAIIDLPKVHAVVESWTGEWQERQEAMSENYNVAHYKTFRAAPTVLFIDFDDDSIASATAQSGDVPTLKFAIASLLDMLHADPSGRPALVFLDISPGAKIIGKVEFQRAPQSWANDPKSSPLAIFAGQACRSGNPKRTQVLLGDSPYTAEVLPLSDGLYRASSRSRASGKIVWSCPLYDGMREQYFWSCVTANDNGVAAALLSPSWFATVVRQADDRFLEAANDGLAAATKSCLGGEKKLALGPDRIRVARSNPITLSFDPSNIYSQYLGGNHVVIKRTVNEMLTARAANQSLADDVRDKIVVIGSTGRFNNQYDLISTKQFGDVPGPLMVAEELRSGWAMGYPQESNWWMSQLIATILVVASFAILKLAREIKKSFGQRPTWIAKCLVIVTNLDVMAIIVIPLLAWSAFALGKAFFDLDGYKIAFAFVVTEIFFVVASVIQEFRGEDPA